MPKALLLGLNSRPKWVTLALAGAILVFFGFLDYFTGREVRFFILYWPAIALATWRAGLRWGIVFASLSGVAWALANVVLIQGTESPLVAVWNTLVNVASFTFLAYVTHRVRAEVDHHEKAAKTDFLTGVSNSRAFVSTVSHQIDRCAREGIPISLAYIDVDDFKGVNDRLGHAHGDALLKVLGETLRRSVRSSDTPARLGGDEFAVLMPGLGPKEAKLILERSVSAIEAELGRHSMEATFSIGAVSSRSGSRSPEEMLRGADALMYEVKRSGKRGIRVAEI